MVALPARKTSIRDGTCAIAERALENAAEYRSLQAAFPAKDLPGATGQSASSRKFEGYRGPSIPLDQLRRPMTKICALAPSKLGSFSTRLMASRSLDRRAESSSQW